MFIITRAQYCWIEDRLVPISLRGYEYEGPVALCGGGPSDATKQQQQVQLESSQQQLAFDSQLMGLFTQQFNSQQSTLNYLKGVLQPIIAQAQGGKGMSDAAEAAMRTAATDANANQFQSVQRALANQETAMNGGSSLPSGVSAQLTAAIDTAEAATQAGTQNQITQYNQNLANSNLFNAANVLNGVAAQVNPLGYASAATSGSGAVASGSGAQAGLQQAITQANNSGFFGSLMNSLGQGFGNLITGGNSSGGSSLGSWFGVCFVAASFWGWMSPKTRLVRLWMLCKAPAWLREFYMKHGEAIAKTPARWAFRPVFEYVLARYA